MLTALPGNAIADSLVYVAPCAHYGWKACACSMLMERKASETSACNVGWSAICKDSSVGTRGVEYANDLGHSWPHAL